MWGKGVVSNFEEYIFFTLRYQLMEDEPVRPLISFPLYELSSECRCSTAEEEARTGGILLQEPA